MAAVRRARTAQLEAEFQLPSRHPLLRRGLQRLKLCLVVRRPWVVDLSRHAPRRPLDPAPPDPARRRDRPASSKTTLRRPGGLDGMARADRGPARITAGGWPVPGPPGPGRRPRAARQRPDMFWWLERARLADLLVRAWPRETLRTNLPGVPSGRQPPWLPCLNRSGCCSAILLAASTSGCSSTG